MFEEIINIFNSREWAFIIWILIFCFWILIKSPAVYKSLLGVLAAVAQLWKFFLLMLCYVGICILLLSKFGIWNIAFIKVTIFWMFGWAIVMFANFTKIGREKGYIKKTLIELLGLTAIVSFVSNFYFFNFLVELLITPLVFILAGMSALAPYNPKYKSVGVFSNNALIILGLCIFLFSLYKTLANFDNFATLATAKEFAVPMLLSAMFLPFVYALSVYGRWEQKRISQAYLTQTKRGLK
jgi:hypothetical protein